MRLRATGAPQPSPRPTAIAAPQPQSPPAALFSPLLPPGLRVVTLAQLAEGANPGCLVLLRPLGVVPKRDTPPA